jgi:hypothetical protein
VIETNERRQAVVHKADAEDRTAVQDGRQVVMGSCFILNLMHLYIASTQPFIG